MTKPYSTDVVVKSITSVLTKEQQSMAATAQAPRRQYYHSRSRVPMQPGEWAVDSDDESDCDWLNELGEAVRDPKLCKCKKMRKCHLKV